MPNFIPLGFVDTSFFQAALVNRFAAEFGKDKRREQFPGSPHHDTESILLRGPKDPTPANWFLDVDHENYPLLADWKTAKNLIARVRNHLASTVPDMLANPVTFGKIMIVRLKPMGFVDWHIDEGEYAERHHRAHLCIIPSPGAVLYSGGEQYMAPVGQIVWCNNRTLHSATNLAHFARTHMIFDVRKPDP